MFHMLFDTHAHLTWGDTFQALPEILKRAREADVQKIVNICTDEETLNRGLEMQEDWIFHAGATTPHDVNELGEKDFPHFEKAAKEGKLIAIGETGLDYFYEHSDRAMQKKYLTKYFHLALETNLPTIIHCRDAFADLFEIADHEYRIKGAPAPCLMHCFTGTWDEAKKALDRNWPISASGIITFKKSEELREVIRKVPLSHLVIETDTPYLAPQKKRGKPNEPALMVETCQCLADLKEISFEEAAQATFENASKFFF